MDRKKISIMILVLFGILFVVGISAGLFRENRDSAAGNEESRQHQKAVVEQNKGWSRVIQSSLDNLGLIDSLDYGRVSAPCTAPQSSRRFVLANSNSCKVKIKGGPDYDNQRVRLVITKGCPAGRDSIRPGRLTTEALVKIPDINVLSNSVVSGAHARPDSSPALEVGFDPVDGDSMDPVSFSCGDEPMDLIIFPDGGTLSLTCADCSDERRFEILLE